MAPYVTDLNETRSNDCKYVTYTSSALGGVTALKVKACHKLQTSVHILTVLATVEA